MNKTLVIYYSNKGSNRFLAKKISDSLMCDIEEIKPRLNAQLLMMMGISFGHHKIKSRLEDYDTIILCGPVWMGKLIKPLRSFLMGHKDKIEKLVFVSCCGSSHEEAHKKYGHGLVFNEVQNLLKEKCIHCEAFPVSMLLSDEEKKDPNLVMKTRLNKDNFQGDIKDQFDAFINTISE